MPENEKMTIGGIAGAVEAAIRAEGHDPDDYGLAVTGTCGEPCRCRTMQVGYHTGTMAKIRIDGETQPADIVATVRAFVRRVATEAEASAETPAATVGTVH